MSENNSITHIIIQRCEWRVTGATKPVVSWVGGTLSLGRQLT